MHLLLPAVGVGMFMVALDQLLVITSYTKIGSELKALNNTSWIATAYFLALTIFQPLYGRLSDIFGRKECLLFAYSVFGLGCLGCGLAHDMAQLCIARAVAGVGGGGVNAVVSILLSDLVPLRDRGIYQGYINVIWGIGTSLGAPLGGLLADSIGWRWSFLVQVPMCLVAWALVYFFLHVPSRSSHYWLQKVRQIDFLGALTLALAGVSLLSGLDAGSNLGWSNLLSVIPLSLTPVFFAAFIYVEVRIASHPFAPGHVIFDPNLFFCYLTNFFGMAGQMAIFLYIPLYFQAVQRISAARSGTLMTPATVAVIVSSVAGGWMIRHYGRFYLPTVLSFGLLLSSIIPLALSVWQKSTVGIVVGLVMAAFGIGSGITTTLVGLLSNAATEDTAVAVACSYLFRSLGSSIGISVTSAVQQQVIRSLLEASLGGDHDGASEIEKKVRQSLNYINELPPDIADLVRSLYRIGTLSATVPTAAFLAAAFLASLWIKDKALKK
ncbi:uncharacterized protein NECHADRAFT_55464 [Fusarium vanettenii 77-13-4]|uniref:Major facilitator superfamily (MFS) profile domain-containing protein n=1 Tax=Fusarium vanettenii (strain ATCC MYA-4622 / CBS 123669 / FGSC 9596 / NRRL 45880 / 77-13-4) TaxID=660122 RepID=C7ZC35_FUSV7|nr:uncharacterized protein NECHADRAFT_56811 [Fusarium vanettenii 77-13-4]XP_003044125.1 uncharacterized protein NECHADRAFT_55464 [Fusarium vanettenii 77-13-4]EEU33349.1 hypothetical protein NECHADRAFT_56811 [Fusarium vanettenii 77-13-4]EEU38412.1 hypothetical protein NECHADRAFT_55464 [Fusarium vanettenii 77-13-4]